MKTYSLFIREDGTPKLTRTYRFELVPAREWNGYQQWEAPDAFYYHCTTEASAQSILRSQTLKPNFKTLMGRGAQQGNSGGRVFLCDRGGVPFWTMRAEEHAFDKYDNAPAIAVLRIPKVIVTQAHTDHEGSTDSHAPAYYVQGIVQGQ